MSVIFRSPLPDVELPETSIGEQVFRHAGVAPDKVAFIDGPTGRSYTYGQIEELSRRMAGALVARGFRKGEVFAIMAPNLPEYAIAFHGVAIAGGVATTINPTYTAEEVEYQLNDAGAKYLLTIAMFMEVASEAVAHSAVVEVFTIDESQRRRPSPRYSAPNRSTKSRLIRMISWCCRTRAVRPACPKGSCSATTTSYRTSPKANTCSDLVTTKSSLPCCRSSTSMGWKC